MNISKTLVGKGEYGYIRSSRLVWSMLTALMLAAVFATYFVPKAYYGTNRNLFTIFAALMCLPAGKMAVRVIMLFRARECDDQTRRVIEGTLENAAASVACAYDLFMTSYDKNYALSHAAASESCVIALTQDAGCDVPSGERHIRNMLEGGGLGGFTVKIFRDPAQYTERLKHLEGHGGAKRASEAISVLLSVSL